MFFYVSGKLWDVLGKLVKAQSVVFYVSGRLWEAHSIEFYESLRLLGGPASNHSK